MLLRVTYALLLLSLVGSVIAQEKSASAQADSKPAAASPDTSASKVIPPGSKLYIAPMANGFETYVSAGILKKEAPVVLVNDKNKADFEMAGVADTTNAGWAKQIFMNSDQSNENASISVTNLKTGQVVWAYSVHKGNSYKGKQSAGEACGKHLKEKIESKQ